MADQHPLPLGPVSGTQVSRLADRLLTEVRAGRRMIVEEFAAQWLAKAKRGRGRNDDTKAAQHVDTAAKNRGAAETWVERVATSWGRVLVDAGRTVFPPREDY